MNSTILILLLIVAGILLAGVGLKVGFSIPARLMPPPIYDDPLPAERYAIPADLPVPVQRYLRLCFGETVPAPQNVVAYGTGRFRVRRIGFLGYLWSPLAWTMTLVPADRFEWHIHLTWFRQKVAEGRDEYRQGKGSFQMGHGTMEGENMDYSEQVMLWLYTFFFTPGALLRVPGITWQAIDEHTAQAQVEQAGRSLRFSLAFDPQTGQLSRIDTSRPSSGKGELFPFSLMLQGQQTFDTSTLPVGLQAAWQDEPYVHYTLAGIQYNGPVEETAESMAEAEAG